MKITIPTATLPTMLQSLKDADADARLKSVAFRFLRCDAAKLRTEKDFREAYSGISACMQVLGPIDLRYQKALDGMRRLIRDLAKDTLLTWDAIEEFDAVWQKAVSVLSKVAPPEKWSMVEDRIRGMFRKNFEG